MREKNDVTSFGVGPLVVSVTSGIETGVTLSNAGDAVSIRLDPATEVEAVWVMRREDGKLVISFSTPSDIGEVQVRKGEEEEYYYLTSEGILERELE